MGSLAPLTFPTAQTAGHVKVSSLDMVGWLCYLCHTLQLIMFNP